MAYLSGITNYAGSTSASYINRLYNSLVELTKLAWRLIAAYFKTVIWEERES